VKVEELESVVLRRGEGNVRTDDQDERNRIESLVLNGRVLYATRMWDNMKLFTITPKSLSSTNYFEVG
jgi:hypothetical protein